jgi:uncharacterized protein RhaS with RHS repeats
LIWDRWEFTDAEENADGTALLVHSRFASPLWAQSNPVQYVYDALGRLTTVVDPSGNVATYNYDAVADPFADSDGDGLTNIYESAIGTNYAAASTTGDSKGCAGSPYGDTMLSLRI